MSAYVAANDTKRNVVSKFSTHLCWHIVAIGCTQLLTLVGVKLYIGFCQMHIDVNLFNKK